MHCFCGNKNATSPNNQSNLTHAAGCSNASLNTSTASTTTTSAPVIFHKEPIIKETAAQVIEKPTQVIEKAPVVAKTETFIHQQPVIEKQQVITKENIVEKQPLLFEKKHIVQQQPIIERQPIVERQHILEKQGMVVEKQGETVVKPTETHTLGQIVREGAQKIIEHAPIVGSKTHTTTDQQQLNSGDMNRSQLTSGGAYGLDQSRGTGVGQFDKTNLHSDTTHLDKLENRSGQINSSRV